MSITYNELIDQVPRILIATNTDLVATMETRVNEAEEQLVLLLDHDLFQTVLPDVAVTPASDIIDISGQTPPVLEVRSIALQFQDDNSWPPLERRDLDFLRMLYASNKPQRPRFYAEYGGQLKLKLFPYPDVTYTASIAANVTPTPLGPAVQTNIISERYARALQKATLRQASLFMKNYNDAKVYEGEMMSAISEANAAIGRHRRDETDVRPVETANVTGN